MVERGNLSSCYGSWIESLNQHWCLRNWNATISTSVVLLNHQVQFSSVAQSCPTLCDPMNRTQHARPPCPSPTSRVHPNPCPLSRWCHPTNLILCCPLLLRPSIFPRIRVFSDESALHIKWPKDWSFSFSISPSDEYSGLISFRMDWLDLLAVQGTLKSLLQHHSSKASILQCLAFFMVQHSHLWGAYLYPGDYRLSNSKTELPSWSLFLVLSEMV